MSFNFLEDREKQDKIVNLCKSIEWHQRSICFTLTDMRDTENYSEAAKRLEKIVNDISELDKDITQKAGWK